MLCVVVAHVLEGRTVSREVETGKRQRNSYDLFDKMLNNVDVLLNDGWYNAVREARANTLVEYNDINSKFFTPERLHEMRVEETSENAHFRLLQWLTNEKYEDAYKFCHRLHNGNIESVVKIQQARGLYTDPLDLNELYPLIEQVFEELLKHKAHTSFHTHQNVRHFR